jgi:hypothetical protein
MHIIIMIYYCYRSCHLFYFFEELLIYVSVDLVHIEAYVIYITSNIHPLEILLNC